MKGKLISVSDGDESSILALGVDDVFNQDDIKVLTTVHISVWRLDLENVLLHLQDGNIKCPATKIVDSNDRILRTIETVSKGSSCRLIDRTKNLKNGSLTSIFSRLTLCIIEIRRHSDYSMATKQSVG
jgi:NAD-specific glutamate dehydrogenase